MELDFDKRCTLLDGSERADHELAKRGSVYRSSNEGGSVSERKKIELSRGSAPTGLTFGIIDSLCDSDEDGQRPIIVESTSPFGKLAKETVCKPSENHASPSLSSPAHLRGFLKSENKNGVQFFEFSVKSPENVYYVAKTWKLDNSLTWVYTFHSLDRSRRKSNAKVWGFKDNGRESAMVGQMAVSSYLCTELKGAGSFNSSMVTEYVLYDTAQSRSSFSRDDSRCETTRTSVISDCENKEVPPKLMNKGRMCKHSRPLAAEELGPELETAAVIMRVPFEKRESLKFRSVDSKIDTNINNKMLPSLLDLCRLEEGICDNLSRGEMHVVVPAGNHGLPSIDVRGPSPLLDRWRLGGGCDCGGWDMGCPLDVLVNPDLRLAGEHPLIDGRHPVGLFVKGRRGDDMPAFTMRAAGNGKYAVDFHARLTSLQAFSICVSILHAAEDSAAVGHMPSQQMLHSDSSKVFPEEEIKNFMDAISEEDKKFKANNCKKKEEGLVSRSFVQNPPFSPIGRV